MFSVTLSMAGGLIAGKEGPFIHAGGIVGGGIAGMGSRSGWLSPVCHHDKWQHCCTLSSIASRSDRAPCVTLVSALQHDPLQEAASVSMHCSIMTMAA